MQDLVDHDRLLVMAAAPDASADSASASAARPIATSTSRLRVSGENVIVGNRRKRPLTCGFLRVPQYTINVLAVERGSPAGGRPDATRLLRLHRRDLGRFGVGCARRRGGRPGRAACASGDAAARAVRARVRGGRRARGASGPGRGTDLGHHRGDPDLLRAFGRCSTHPTCRRTPCTSRTGSSRRYAEAEAASNGGTSRR